MNTFYIGLISIALLSCADQPNQLVQVEGKQIQITDSFEKDKEFEEFIAPYRERIEEEMEGVLAYTPKAMTKSDYKFNTPIGNMMADAVMEIANPIFNKRTGNDIDLVILNYGGIRSGINAGDLTIRTAYDIMPFENEVAVAKLNSDEIHALVNYLVKNKVAHPIAGLQVTLDADGNLKNAKVNGKQIQNIAYNVATSDYLIKGGDRMDFFKTAEEVHTLDYKLRNLFIDYFKLKDTITPVRDDRFIQL